jgi:hypothetical protein
VRLTQIGHNIKFTEQDTIPIITRQMYVEQEANWEEEEEEEEEEGGGGGRRRRRKEEEEEEEEICEQ